jgi:hypothetical protein
MCIAGCSNLNYVGQHFTPTPPGKGIELFNGRENIPVNKYTIIGKITLESDTIPNKYVVEKDLTAKARAVGGDALCIVEQRNLKRGAYTTTLEQHGANPGNPNPELLKKYGNPLPLQGEKSSMIVVQIRALVLKDKEAVNKLLNK